MTMADQLSPRGHTVGPIPQGVREQVITCLDKATRAALALSHVAWAYRDLITTVQTIVDDHEDDLPVYSPVAEEIGLEDLFRVLMRVVDEVTGRTEGVRGDLDPGEPSLFLLVDRVRRERGLDPLKGSPRP